MRRRIGRRLWRRLHTGTLAVYLLSLVHTLTAGTDAGTTWLRALLALPALVVAALLAARLLRRPEARRPPRVAPRTTS